MSGRWWVGGAKLAAAGGAAGVALAAAGVASAKPRVELTGAAQAAARAAVLQRADLGPASGWTGGAKTPKLSSEPACSSFRPKDSDLVVNGAAEADWTHSGLEFDSEAHVMQTPRMVRLDWQRAVLSPRLLPCLREAFQRTLGTSAMVVSARRVAFPKVASYTAAIRTLLDVTSGGHTVRVMIDVIVFGRGRSELTLTATAVYDDAAAVRPAEIRLARLMASRIQF